MRNLFLKAKSCAVLLLLKDPQHAWYPSKLARAAGASYVHTVNLLSALLKQGVVSQERKGRQKYYRLTDKGASLASSLDDFSRRCEAASQEAGRKPEAQQPSPPQQPALQPQEQQKQEKPALTEKKAA